MTKFNQLTEELILQLQAAAPGHILIGDDINEDYSHDEMPIYGKRAPQIVFMAHSTEEVAAVIKICNENKIPVTPRGSGTGLVGGAVPLLGGVLIDLTKMNKILSYDLENFVVHVEAGVLLKDLAEDCVKQGLFYAPDPGEKLACLGGNVSTNAGGMRAVKYGATRDYVRAMTVVLPTGETTKFGATVSKTSSGYSLLNLMIGSEGTLGIITELTLKTMVAPKVVASLIIPFENLEDCISAVPKFKMEHMNPQALEFMEREIVLTSERYIGKSVFPQVINGVTANAYLLVTLDASNEDELNDLIEQASEIVLEAGAIDVLVADTPAKIKDAWAARSSFLDAIIAETKLLDECDVVVPINKIASYLAFVNKTGKECGITIKSFGHAGDGNLHIYQCSNDLEESEFKIRVEKFFEIIYKEAIDCGGLVSGEHGIGSGKMSYLAECVGDINIELMKGIKKTFDPNSIMNPGKVCCPINAVN